jgi:membrane fusion protein, multidrug efflux system
MDALHKRACVKEALIITVLILAFALAACGNKEAPVRERPPVPVVAGKAVKKDVPVEVDTVGNVEAYETVSVKSLVAGEITAVGFTEGRDVKKGELLFTIDPRPLEAELAKAKGVLARDTVQADNAASDAARAGELFKKGVIARQDYDQSVATAASLKETVKADEADVESIKVQLGYTKIYSPIDGRTGNLNVNLGNIVKANDTPYLVVINRMSPIYVTFSLPEGYLTAVRKRMPAGLMVQATPNGDAGAPEEGKLSFIDNAVDTTTGTIRMKALFNNRDKRLWPGQFVNVRIILDTLKNATLVPSQAVQTGQDGPYLFVLSPDGKTVELRTVKTGISKDDATVIEQGVSPGDSVVVDGQLQLVSGSRVSVRGAKGSPPEKAQ